jgi:biopolymer transport protein ExbD
LPKTELNITSMMDLVLNLLMFFVLVSNFALAELPALSPPDPTQSKARPGEAPNKITVNILPDGESGKARLVKVGTTEIVPAPGPGGGLVIPELAKLLEHEKSIDDKVQIDLRADRSLTYDQVQPVMAEITNAGISRVNVVAQISE